MHDWFPGYAPTDLWLRGWVGRFGWGDFGFSDAFVAMFGALLAVLTISALRRLYVQRDVLRRRRHEAIAYALMLVGLLALLAYVGYSYRLVAGSVFEQARYLFPLLALYAGLLGLGLLGLPQRVRLASRNLFIVLAGAHLVAGIAISVERYYL